MKPNIVEQQIQRHQINAEHDPTRAKKCPDSASANGCNGPRMSVRGSSGARPPDPEKRTILLISDDARLHQNLRSIANPVGRMVVRVDGAADVLRIVYAVKPAAVLLDLDLPAEAGWVKADALLQEQSCPPVILLTARSEPFDVRSAIRAGSLVDKSADPTRLLEVVDQILAVPDSSLAERTATQRVVIRWLRPCRWSVPLTPAYRFWGINE